MKKTKKKQTVDLGKHNLMPQIEVGTWGLTFEISPCTHNDDADSSIMLIVKEEDESGNTVGEPQYTQLNKYMVERLSAAMSWGVEQSAKSKRPRKKSKKKVSKKSSAKRK